MKISAYNLLRKNVPPNDDDQISPSLRTKWPLSNRPITLFMMSTNNKTNDEKIYVAVKEARSNETSSAQKIQPTIQKVSFKNQLLMMMREYIKRRQSQKQKELQQSRVKLWIAWSISFFVGVIGTGLAIYQAYFSKKSDNRQEKKEDPKLRAKLHKQTQDEQQRVQYKKFIEEYGRR